MSPGSPVVLTDRHPLLLHTVPNRNDVCYGTEELLSGGRGGLLGSRQDWIEICLPFTLPLLLQGWSLWGMGAKQSSGRWSESRLALLPLG